MKTVVISGARSGIGKTYLAWQFSEILDNAAVIKIGHGKSRPELKNFFYPHGTPFEDIRQRHGGVKWLIIESNRILEEITPELAVFLDADSPKSSAAGARAKADVISGARISREAAATLAARMELSLETVRRLIWLSGARPEATGAVILAGGESARMGEDKSGLSLGRETMLQHLVSELQPVFDCLVVSCGRDSDCRVDGAIVIHDPEKGKGPLMGICAGLNASPCEVNFVVAVDIPEIHIRTVRELLSWSGQHQIVVPSLKEGNTEPLFGIYRKHVARQAQLLLKKGLGKISLLYDRVSTHVVPVRQADWYYNLNTPEDYAAYLRKRGQ